MKILNIEDNESAYQLMLHHLKKGGVRDVIALRVSSEEELRSALASDKWNVVISDYNIPGIDPLFALRIVRETNKYLPFIVVSGTVGEESVAEMMKAGVQDFVMKSRLERLGPVIKRSLRELAVHEQEARSRTIAKRAMAAKEEMLAIVYHDIKNPLSAIQLDAQLLEILSKKEPGPEVMNELQVHAKRVLRTVDRLKVLVSDLLEHNNPLHDDGEQETFTIKKAALNPLHIINDVLDSFRPLIQEKSIVIKKVILQEQSTAMLDKERIHQVLANILSNALKFSPMNGEITIELKDGEGEIIFSVKDNGPGIENTDLSRIFEKYWTGGSGNGLGLFICKSIIEAHGGKILADSSKGKGATFTIKIPTVLEEIIESGLVINLNPKRNEIIKTIYLVDDDHDLREVLSWALEKEGYRVLSFDKAQNALDALDHTFYTPDLIVLDFHMDKMKGNEFLARKFSNGEDFIKKCPVIIISASPEDVKKSTASSLYTDILTKPVGLPQLLRTVKQYV
jgi:signal transduction histidine kinase